MTLLQWVLHTIEMYVCSAVMVFCFSVLIGLLIHVLVSDNKDKRIR